MWNWYTWLALGLVLFVFATIFTFLWWKIGDQWADAEYKKFGHGGGGPADTSKATVIKDFEAQPKVVRTQHTEDDADPSTNKATNKVSPD